MNVVVINYGLGNLGSVRRALEECGADVRVSQDPAELAESDRIVLPGVGAFAEGMALLNEGGWPRAIAEALKNPRVALLGICLGMQLLADHGEEGGETAGLGLIGGTVSRLMPATGERIPHVGWNEVVSVSDAPLLREVKSGSDFYFVHSYHFRPASADEIIATTPYAGGFVSAVQKANILGVQFHPEKSSKPGFRLLRNFLSPDLC